MKGRPALHYIIITRSTASQHSQSVPRRPTFMSPGLCTVGATRYCLDGALSKSQWWPGLNYPPARPLSLSLSFQD